MENSLSKKLDWKVGLSIALGVPLLIMPSIVYFSTYMWAFSIIIWGISVIQGFIQNLAYGEMAVAFPDASGLPGYSQKILGDSENSCVRFLGGFSAWSYWFAWAPIPAIFTLSIVEFIVAYFPSLSNIPTTLLSLIVGTCIFAGMFINNRKGVESSAWVGYLMNAVALIPLIILATVPFITGSADVSNITGNWIPTDFAFDVHHVIILFGLFGMAQWSACAWETAAVYGPEYKNPKKDVLKALFSCGFICLVVYVLVQAACIAVLGVQGVNQASQPPIILLAEFSFGKIGGIISAVMLLTAMLSIIQTGFLGASRAMYSMSVSENLPQILKKTNKYAVPQNAMIAIIILDYALLLLGKPSAIVAASSIGYAITNGITLYSYVKYKKSIAGLKREKNSEYLNTPKIWSKFGLIFAFVNMPLYLVGLVYINSLDAGWSSTIVGGLVLIIYVPLYFYSKFESGKVISKKITA